MTSQTVVPPLGVLMLETRFPRLRGDIGNPASFDFPVLYRTVPQAWPARIVKEDPSALLPAFIEAGQALVAEGAQGITTSCGFLSLFQAELSAALPVPVLTTALMEAARLQSELPDGQRLGILTISATSLTRAHLDAAGVPDDVHIATTEGGQVFTAAILENRQTFDPQRAEADNVAAACAMVAADPSIGAILLECTNMGPYADAIARATQRPVYSIITALTRFHKSLTPAGAPPQGLTPKNAF